MALRLAKRIPIYGIMPNSQRGALAVADPAVLNFPVFIPENLALFRKLFRLRLDLSQTILVIGGRVRQIRVGLIQPDDYLGMLTLIKTELFPGNGGLKQDKKTIITGE